METTARGRRSPLGHLTGVHMLISVCVCVWSMQERDGASLPGAAAVQHQRTGQCLCQVLL